MTGQNGADAVVAVCACALLSVDLWRLAAAWRRRPRRRPPYRPIAQRFADAMVADLMDDIDTLYGTTCEPARTDV